MENYYAILGVRIDADEVVIAAAYRALAKKYHPDTGGSNGSKTTAQFRRVQEAYDTLRDRNKRAQYNDKLATARSRNKKSTGDGTKAKQTADASAKEDSSQRQQSRAKPATKVDNKSPRYLMLFRRRVLISGLAVATIILAVYYVGHDTTEYSTRWSSYRLGTANVDLSPKDFAKAPEVADVKNGGDGDAIKRSKSTDNSIEKGGSPLPKSVGVARDIFGRDLPYVNSSGKEDLSAAHEAAIQQKCKLYNERIVGEAEAAPVNKVYNDRIVGEVEVSPVANMDNVLCLEKLRYDESARNGIIAQDLEEQKVDSTMPRQ